MSKPLEGIRVLDLSHMLPGPFCTMTLADMGAEVIKVENPYGGDSFRSRKPFLKEEGTAFLMLNRNKKSVIVDFKDESARGFFMRLVESADVVLEQFRPGTAKKLGIDYESVTARNPKIIYCSLSGYGQTGSYAGMPGHDINYLSLSGVLDAIGDEAGPPVVPGVQIADLGGGAQWALTSILLALLARNNDGLGRYIDVSMTRCMVPWMNLYLSHYASDGTIPLRGSTKGSGHFACYHVYETSDKRYVSLGAAEPKFWIRFCEVVGKPELAADQYAEGKRRQEIIAELKSMFIGETQQHWIDLLFDKDVCFTPVRSFDEVSRDGDAAFDLIRSYEHPCEGSVLNIGFPVSISGVDSSIDAPAPLYGADTGFYLREAGYSEEDVREYQKKVDVSRKG